ncbi:MAG TPA: flagellar hook-basal body protein [Solirubrobacteraceae bacterium]|jgi:flagellar basal-body rod protein FlgG
MDRGLYIAASGMLAEMARQDLLANDLANASTPGYKADRAEQRSFADVLLANTRTGAPVGPVGTGSAITSQGTDLSGAPLKDTGEPLDFAIAGDGFFAVRTPQGQRFTRNGSFQTDGNGQLTDQLGNPVLDEQGRAITVGTDGTVPPTALGVFAVTGARKAGDNLFTGTAAGRATGEVRSGALEDSGVNPARAMIDMIASLRAFESGQKAIQTIDATLDQAATKVGSTS